MSPVFLSGVCIVHVKTRSPIFACNDPASLLCCLHCELLLLSPDLTLFFFLEALHLWFAPPLKNCLCFRVSPVLSCVNSPRGRLWNIHSAGDTSSHRRPHWGQTRQKIRSSLRWPLDVVCWHDARLGGVWGEEASSGDTAHCREDFSLKTEWQGNKASAVICALHNDCVYVVHSDWSHLCLQCSGLWSSCSRPPPYGGAEHNITHCWRSAWNLSSSVIATM